MGHNEEGGEGMRSVLSRRLAGIVALATLVIPLAASPQAAGDYRPDTALVRTEIRAFEVLLNRVVGSIFGSVTFATQPAKGAYLPSYGASFSFVVNIHRALINTPLGEIRRDGITPDEKKKRIEGLKERLVRLLFENADNLRQLRREENIAIVAFIEDRSFPEEESQNRTVVLSVARKDVEGVAGNEERWKDFRQKVRILEY